MKVLMTRILYTGVNSSGNSKFKIFLVDEHAPRPRPSVEMEVVFSKGRDGKMTTLFVTSSVLHNVKSDMEWGCKWMAILAFRLFNPIPMNVEQVVIEDHVYDVTSDRWQKMEKSLLSIYDMHWAPVCDITELRPKAA